MKKKTKTKKPKLVWIARNKTTYHDSTYVISPTKLKLADRINGDTRWHSAQAVRMCVRGFHACTTLRMKPGAEPVQMEISMLEVKA